MSDINVIVRPITIETVVNDTGQEVSVSVQPIDVTVQQENTLIATENTGASVHVGPQGPEGPQGEPGLPGLGGADPVGVKVFRNDPMIAASDDNTVINFQEVSFDLDTMWGLAQPSRLVCVTAGIYQVTAQLGISFETPGAFADEGRIDLLIFKNGSELLSQSTEMVQTPNPIPTRNHHLQVDGVVALQPGEYVQLQVFQNSGVGGGVIWTESQTWMSAVRLGSALNEPGASTAAPALYFSDSNVIQPGDYLMGAYRTSAAGTANLAIVTAKVGPQGTDAVFKIEINGINTAPAITLGAGQTYAEIPIQENYAVDSLVKTKLLSGPVLVENMPSGVAITIRSL